MIRALTIEKKLDLSFKDCMMKNTPFWYSQVDMHATKIRVLEEKNGTGFFRFCDNITDNYADKYTYI